MKLLDVKWLKEADALMAYSIEHFYDDESECSFLLRMKILR